MHRGSAVRRWGTRKKLPRTDHATSSRPCHRYGLGSEGFDLHGVAKVSEAFDQTSFFLVIGAVVKVFATEVVIHRPILKHVVDGREDGGGDGHDSLLRTAAGFDSVKLRLQVAVLLILCCPRALHQRGFEPGSPLAQAVGSALAGTDRKSTRLNSSHVEISYAVFCLKK